MERRRTGKPGTRITTDQDLLPLIGHIYDAALDPALWNDFMLAASDVFKGTTGFLAMLDFKHPNTSILKMTRFAPHLLDHYMTHFSQERDLWYQLIRTQCTTGSIFIGSELIAGQELKKTDMFNEVLKPTEGGHLVGCYLDGSETMPAAFTISRPMNGPDFTKQDKQIMSLLGPHLQRAYRVHRQYMTCQQAQLSAQEALHQASTAMILLNDQGQVVFLNRKAEKIVQQADGIQCFNSRLRVDSSTDRQAFEVLVGEATLTARQCGTHPGGALRVSRFSGKLPYQVMVTPLNLRSDRIQMMPTAAVCILVHDPEAEITVTAEQLDAFYGLTPAEARVVQGLLADKTPAEIAALHHLKISTVRTHLLKIFSKTQTTSQAQLIRRITSGLKAERRSPVFGKGDAR